MPICHSWSIVYPYTHNISCLTITLHESLGPYAHPYVSIADAHKSKTMQFIALMESLVLNLIGRFLGQLLGSHFAHQPFYNIYISYIHCMPTYIHNIYISYIHCILSIYTYIAYIYSMLQHTYLIHTLYGIIHPSIYISHIYIMSQYAYHIYILNKIGRAHV